MNWQLYLFASIWIVSLQAGDKAPSLPVELTDKTKFVPIQSNTFLTFLTGGTAESFKAECTRLQAALAVSEKSRLQLADRLTESTMLTDGLKAANMQLVSWLVGLHSQYSQASLESQATIDQLTFDAHFWQAYAQKLEEKLYPAPEALPLASSTSDDIGHQQSGGRRPAINPFKE